jgi:hypothetical protein
MKRPRREPEALSAVSFLDVLANGAGAAILLFILFGATVDANRTNATDASLPRLRLHMGLGDADVVAALSIEHSDGTSVRLVTTARSDGLEERYDRKVEHLGSHQLLLEYDARTDPQRLDLTVMAPTPGCWEFNLGYIGRSGPGGWPAARVPPVVFSVACVHCVSSRLPYKETLQLGAYLVNPVHLIVGSEGTIRQVKNCPK